MDDILDKMDPEKRKALIDSAMKEFGENKYDKASTNTIVKEAGISKGLLYHYFKSKKVFYDALFIYTLKTFGKAFEEGIDWTAGDPINRLKEIAKLKMEIIDAFPNIMKFGKVMYDGKSLEEIKVLIDAFIPDIYTRIYSYNIDYSLFKEGIDVSKAMNMIQLFIDGYSEDLFRKMNQSKDDLEVKEIMADLDQYLDMYKKAFYKD